MLMVSGITLLFLPVCSRKRVSISIGVPVRQHPPARLTQGFAGLQKALKSYRRVYRVTEGFKKLQRALQGYRGLYRVTEGFTFTGVLGTLGQKLHVGTLHGELQEN